MMKTLNTKKKPKPEALELTGVLTFDHNTWDSNVIIGNDISWNNSIISIESVGPEHRNCPNCRTQMNHMLITKPGAVQETWNGCERCGHREKL